MPAPDSARLVCYSGWGEPTPPAFSFDLLGGALWRESTSQNVARYGPEPDRAARYPSRQSDDGRPVALALSGSVLASPTFSGASDLLELASGVVSQPVAEWDGGEARVWSGSSFIGENGAFTLRDVYLHPRRDDEPVTAWKWGTPGAGGAFFVKGASASFGFLSSAWNETEWLELMELWRAGDFEASADAQRQDELEALLFDSMASVSGSDWIERPFSVTIVPEARGAVHLLVNGQTTSIENARLVEQNAALFKNSDSLQPVWGASGVSVYSTPRAFHFALATPRFAPSGTLTFGPYKNGYFTEYLGDLVSEVSALGSVSVERIDYNDVEFGFEVTLTRDTSGVTPWLYALSARLQPSGRTGSDTVSFDTTDLYAPLGGEGETSPILDVEPTWEGASRGTTRRGARITMRDVLGRTTTTGGATTAFPVQCVADLTLGDAPFLTGGIVTSARQGDLAALQLPGGGTSVANNLAFTARAESTLVVQLSDKWTILEETLCTVRPVGDGLRLGAYLRALLALAGMTTAEMAGVGASEGPLLPRGAPGDGFLVRPDEGSSVASAIAHALDVRGLGYTFFEDRSGVWQLKRPSASVVAAFNGNAATNTPHTPQGRLTILQPLDVEHDLSDYYNSFTVRGGRDGEISREWTQWESLRQRNYAAWLGRRKSYPPVVDSSLTTTGEVEYALRSLRWRHSRGGRRAQFETYFHTSLEIGDRITIDGGTWELLGVSGGSWANDTMQFFCLEVSQ